MNPDFKGGGCATLTDLYNAQDGKGPLWVLDSNDNKVDGAGGSAKPTGRWLLTSNLKIEDDVTLFVEGKGRGGDCDVLRIEVREGGRTWSVFGRWGVRYVLSEIERLLMRHCFVINRCSTSLSRSHVLERDATLCPT